jgi:Flp pilus assembly secretin CpaC
LEESRRSHGELALTAGGGSLLDRVARLLGRSGPDDRRVSWLPGTIALLVAGIVIPMALALAASASDRPEPPSADVAALLSEARDTAPTEEPDAAKVSLAMEAAGEQEKAEVDIQVMILAVGEGRRLDTKTVRQIEQILGEQVRAQDRTGGFWRRQSTTVGEVFRKHILWRHLSPQSVQALTDLLSSKKNVTPLAKPRVLVPDGEEARVWIGSIEPVRVESSDGERAGRTEVKMVDVGVKICVTPHVGDQNNVTVSLTAEVTDLLPRPGHPDLPLVRCRTADQTFTISSGRYFVSTMPTTTGTVGKEDSLYILVMPSIVKAQPSPSSADTPITPQTMETRRVRLNYTDPERALRLLASAFQPYVRPEPGDSTDPNNRDLIITAPAAIAERIVAEIRSIDVHPRNILIDALVAVMDSRDLQDLGIDWGTPSMPAGSTGDPAGRWPRGITVGISFDKTFRQSLDTILNPLKENNKAHVISAPRVVACEGRRARIRVNQEDHVTTPAGVQGGFFFTQAQSEMIVSGTTVEVTPLVGDNNIITLETAVEVSDTVPRGRDSDLSAVTRRTAWNSITIRDGGTIAIAGLAEGRERAGLTAELRDSSPAGQGREDESSRELVLFLTATIVPQTADTQAAHP